MELLLLLHLCTKKLKKHIRRENEHGSAKKVYLVKSKEKLEMSSK